MQAESTSPQQAAGYRTNKDKMKSAPPLPGNVQNMAELLRVVAEPKRLLILDLLMQGVQCNCELGEALRLAPNLISHHLSVLRKAGLVNMERDALDARWVYYSINRGALDELNSAWDAFFNPSRILPRRPSCGPASTLISEDEIARRQHNE